MELLRRTLRNISGEASLEKMQRKKIWSRKKNLIPQKMLRHEVGVIPRRGQDYKRPSVFCKRIFTARMLANV
jgi:hypothetical protein